MLFCLFCRVDSYKEKVIIDNCPALADVDNMANILQSLGAELPETASLLK